MFTAFLLVATILVELECVHHQATIINWLTVETLCLYVELQVRYVLANIWIIIWVIQ